MWGGLPSDTISGRSLGSNVSLNVSSDIVSENWHVRKVSCKRARRFPVQKYNQNESLRTLMCAEIA